MSKKVQKIRRIIATILLVCFIFTSTNLPAMAVGIYEEYELQKQYQEILNMDDETLIDVNPELEEEPDSSNPDLDEEALVEEPITDDSAIVEDMGLEIAEDTELITHETERFIIRYVDKPVLNEDITTAIEDVKEIKKKGILEPTLPYPISEITVDTEKIRLVQDEVKLDLEKSLGRKKVRIEAIVEDNKLAVIETNESTTVEELYASIEDTSNILYIQPDYEMMFYAYDEQEMETTEKVFPQLAENAVSNNIVIALLDTGVDTNHSALQGNLLLGYDFVNKDNSVNDEEYYYDQWHGTGLAGVLAESGSKVMPLKIFQGGRAYTSDIIAAIEYAETNGAKIANMSFGGRYENQALSDAMAESTMLFVCAAGNLLVNTDEYPIYPASFDLPNILAVASVNEEDKLSRFSNYGINSVDIATLGENITVLGLENGQAETSGTSVSAAKVTSAAAQVLAARSQLGAEDLKDWLIQSADQITGLTDKIKAGKRLNLNYALSSAIEPNPNIIDVPDDEPLPEVRLGEDIEEDDYEEAGADGLITYRTPMPTAREGLAVAAVGKKIYAIGGQYNSTYYNKVEIYNTETDTWTTGTDMPTSRSYFAYVVKDTLIYCIGGRNGSYLNTVEVYNTVSNSWSTKTVFPQSLMGVAAVEYNNKIYVSGGYNGSFQNYVYEYNISTNAWTQRGTLLNARAYHSVFLYNGKMYVEGGANSTTGWYVDIEEQYNLSSYSSISSGVSRVYGMKAAALNKDDRLLIIGGSKFLNAGAYTNYQYSNLITQRSMYDGNNYHNRIFVLSSPRAGMGAAMVDNVVYIMGGQDHQYIYNTVEVLETGYTTVNCPHARFAGQKNNLYNGKRKG